MDRINVREINKKLQHGYVLDLTKPEIDKFDRARILKKFMDDHKYSYNDMCKQFGFKKGTLAGWMKWDTLSRESYMDMRKDGLSESDITNMLKKAQDPTLENELISMLEKIDTFLNKKCLNLNDNQLDKVRSVRNKLNTVLYKNGQ